MIVFIDGPCGSGKSTACEGLVQKGFRHVRLFRGTGEHKDDPGWMKAAGVPYNDWIEDFVLLEAFVQLQLSDNIVCDRVAVSGLVWEMMAGVKMNISNHPLPQEYWDKIATEIDKRLNSFPCLCFYLRGSPFALAKRCRQHADKIAAEMGFYDGLVGASTVPWKSIDTTFHTPARTLEMIWNEICSSTRPL